MGMQARAEYHLRIETAIKARPKVKTLLPQDKSRVVVAGSYRRGQDTVGDKDWISMRFTVPWRGRRVC
jgi:DNA polymerase/3'-5' exonuclease PolX